jgi:hypothetical protein
VFGGLALCSLVQTDDDAAAVVIMFSHLQYLFEMHDRVIRGASALSFGKITGSAQCHIG